MKRFAERHPDLAVAVLLLAILACAIGLNACGASPTDPTPSPTPGSSTHGSSSVDPGAQACLVSGATIAIRINGVITNGYFSVSDKGVGVSLRYKFLPGTDLKGDCPGPTSADWGFGNVNDALCTYTGTRSDPAIRVDCQAAGKSTFTTPVVYPDGSTDVIVLDVTVS